jgi:hypothetical protein
VDAIIFLVMLAGSMMLGVMGARTMLGAILHAMASPPAPMSLLRGGVAFGAAAAGLWYLAPVIAAQLP